ncbi:Very-long-chain (3R)-3-hydroxyacyl-CoA dehydratase [Armadillidium vulgare]|nr:Very-long-chain (3R)-3-hydroxyacyl-CoA dehydratase [Armadillidium vulgare]
MCEASKKGESMKKVYLFLYNLWQFVGFLYIVIVILTRYSKSGKDSMEGTYEAVSWMMKLCFMTQFLEIFHPVLGYTKGSVLEPLMQVPYYLLRVYDIEIGLLTWLRYSIWMPLYPLGIVLEGVVMLRSIPYFEETQKFTISLPNSLNFAFHFPTLIRCYLLLFFFPVMYKMISHMYVLRTKKLGPQKSKKD